MRNLGSTEIKIAPLVLGGNVFGWTADREASFAVLDAFLEAGFNAIDTADYYPGFIPGMEPGGSETVLGEWIKDRGVRDRVVLITKGGLDLGKGGKGLGRDYLPNACEASLKRLQTDYIDVYMAHRADAEVPIEETLETFQALRDAGKVRYAGCSNYTAEELSQALDAAGEGRARYEVLEPHYNLADRQHYQGPLEALCVQNRIGVLPYFALASGFLTGKYRSLEELDGSPRSQAAAAYLNNRGLALLRALDTVAARNSASPAQVALAWLMNRPSVTAPIASATSVLQLRELIRATELQLTFEDIEHLSGSLH